MKCKHCGAEIPDDSIFCEQCGKKQDEGAVSPSSQKKLWIIIGVAAVVLAVILFFVIRGCSSTSSDNKDGASKSNLVAYTLEEFEKGDLHIYDPGSKLSDKNIASIDTYIQTLAKNGGINATVIVDTNAQRQIPIYVESNTLYLYILTHSRSLEIYFGDLIPLNYDKCQYIIKDVTPYLTKENYGTGIINCFEKIISQFSKAEAIQEEEIEEIEIVDYDELPPPPPEAPPDDFDYPSSQSEIVAVAVEEEEEEEDRIFNVPEKDPEFPGGMDALYQYLANNINYPKLAQENGITGKVYVTFVVEKDGRITGVRVLRDIGGGCGAEAVRVVKNMPRWTPGKMGNRIVRTQFNLPINFTFRN